MINEMDDDINNLLYNVWINCVGRDDEENAARCFVEAWYCALAHQDLRDSEEE